MHVDGSCYCGQIAFTGDVEPDNVTICHCEDCQEMSGSAFRANIACPADRFHLTKGEPKVFVKVADSGARRDMTFCGNCGTQIYSRAADGSSAYSLRTGTLKQRADLSPARQIWLRSATPWASDLLDTPRFEKEPPTG